MNLVLPFFVLVIAALYASVGHGGATGYLAVMSIGGLKPDVMASTALILNCLTSAISFYAYQKEGYFSFRLICPFLVTSIPAAYLGAMANLSEAQFSGILAVVLIFSGYKLWTQKVQDSGDESNYKKPQLFIASSIGLLLGFLAGAIGIGGGVFLSPVIMFLGWASAKTTAGCAALFILLNSITGISARFISGKVEIENIWPFLLSALIGAVLGATYGSKYSSPNKLRKLVSVVLVLAAIKMFVAS